MYTTLYPMTYYFYPLLEDKFTDSSHRDTFRQILNSPKQAATENLLYLHIPYCHDMCRFCPFHVRVDKGSEIYDRYTEALCKEMELVAKLPYVSDMSFKAVYFGGGSPSIFSVNNLRKIFAHLSKCFQIEPNAEISFEGEPKTLSDPARLDLLKEYNVKRISFGLQTYNEKIRELFNIAATLKDVDNCTKNARERGFEDINVDMMYDLPGQDITALNYDLAHLKDHDFDSLDYYNLHYFAFPKKFKMAMKDGTIPSKPSQQMHFALQQQLRTTLKEMGYYDVADPIFAKKPQVCDYFRLIWGGGKGDHSAEMIALGSSARGYVNGYCYMNLGNTEQYLKTVEAGQLPLEKLSLSLPTPENRGAAFFVKFFEIDKTHEKAIQSIPQNVWNFWRQNGLIYETAESWKLSEVGKLWTTNMMLDTFEVHQREAAMTSLGFVEDRPGVRTGSF
ncbi:radical SAM protein [Moorena sp. SIO3I6]|uniref:coproporphyrinogen-III oxidase family protein n=1 Tax=Moorena sp. SIO3I6 TaxID=2607831 RepID=UPI0013FB99F7|nr:radical SAM protein [Moorena sp. SIO3I6]NEP23067.1 radical SAM protein [Moorena sp. SIO3I6]